MHFYEDKCLIFHYDYYNKKNNINKIVLMGKFFVQYY